MKLILLALLLGLNAALIAVVVGLATDGVRPPVHIPIGVFADVSVAVLLLAERLADLP